MTSSPLVVVERQALDTIRSVAAASGFRHEVGGVLLGSYRGPHIHVVNVTQPQERDRSSFNRFWRRPDGHQTMAEAAWLGSGRTVTYVGEWHTHPEPVPRPSWIDRMEWSRKLAEQHRDLVFLIQGQLDVYLEYSPMYGGKRALVRAEDGADAVLYRPRPNPW